MLCQSVKREQWVDKLKATLLKVPYVHSVFTLPHQLNGLARSNEATIYRILLRSAWETIKVLGQRQLATPGMTSILHTFGSDMKYHIHVHALVTFGGLTSAGDWIYPEHKHRIHKYRVICATFRDTFLRLLYKQLLLGKLTYHLPIMPLLDQVQKIRWVVHSTRPTMDTTIIEQYLAKYINRVAVSNKRLNYLKDTNQVVLVYNDYKKQLTGQPAPKAFKTMSPLLAINQILQHVLPPYFQKSRRYGLHNSSSNVRKNIPDAVKRNPCTIRTVFEIITTLLQIKPYHCEVCGSINYELDNLLPDQTWIFTFISIEPRSPPQATATITLQTAKTTDMQS
jgi:Putative transposase